MSSQGREGFCPSLPLVHSILKSPLSADSSIGGGPTDGAESSSRPPPGPPVRKKSMSCSVLPILAPSTATMTAGITNIQTSVASQPSQHFIRVSTAATVSSAPWSARPLQRTASVGACLSQSQTELGLHRRNILQGHSHGPANLCLDFSVLTLRPRSHVVSQDDINHHNRTFSDFLNEDDHVNVHLSPSAKCTRWLEHMQLVGGGRCLDDAVHEDAANG